MKHKIRIILASLLLTTGPSMASETSQVMLLGTFHFSNPGLDSIKTDQINIAEEENQSYLRAFTQRLANTYRPTEVLVECDRKNQSKLDKRYQDYLAGNYQLAINEIYQLGFRVGKAAKVKRITCYDERDVMWQAGPLMKSMPVIAPDVKKDYDKLIQQMTVKIEEMQRSLPLKALLLAYNDLTFDALNKSLYISSNEVGAGETFAGADAAASWWHRNFRMYANIQRAAKPGSRVFVVGGQGHIAIIRDLLALDGRREAVNVITHL